MGSIFKTGLHPEHVCAHIGLPCRGAGDGAAAVGAAAGGLGVAHAAQAACYGGATVGGRRGGGAPFITWLGVNGLKRTLHSNTEVQVSHTGAGSNIEQQ